MPRAKHAELLSSLYEDYGAGVINSNKMSQALRVAGHPFSTSDPRRQFQLRRASRMLKGSRGPRRWRGVRKVKDILDLSEDTGLLATLVAVSIPLPLEVLVEPEVSVGEVTYTFDYALGERSGDEFQLKMLTEVKRLASTSNLIDYVRSFFIVANELLNIFPLNVDEGSKEVVTPILALHLHLIPPLTEQPNVVRAVEAFKAVRTLNEKLAFIVTLEASFEDFRRRLIDELQDLATP